MKMVAGNDWNISSSYYLFSAVSMVIQKKHFFLGNDHFNLKFYIGHYA